MRELEVKFARLGAVALTEDAMVVEGYASFFGLKDQGGDVVEAGAYARSLAALKAKGRTVKMLWQHDAGEVIGVWDEVREDDRGLFVKGRVLTSVARGREAAELIGKGAIDGLSIGYRTLKARKGASGERVLVELDLWEVSLVTFPMLAEARLGAKSGGGLAGMIEAARSAVRAL
jgi:uncharacterized protein